MTRVLCQKIKETKFQTKCDWISTRFVPGFLKIVFRVCIEFLHVLSNKFDYKSTYSIDYMVEKIEK